MSRVSLCRRSHSGCVLHEQKLYMLTHTSIDSMCTGILHRQHNGGNKNKMELHPPFRKEKKKKGHKRKMNYDPCRN